MQNEFVPKAAQFKVRGKIYWRVRIGTTKGGSAKYESFGTDKEKAEIYAKKLQTRANAKRQAEIGKLSEEEATDLRWALDTLSNYGATVKEAAEWFVRTKFPEKGNKTVAEVGQIYLKQRKEEIAGNTYENYERKIEILSGWFGEKLINEVNTKQLEEFFSEKGKAWGPNTMNPWKKFVIFFFKWVQDRGYIHREGYTAADHLTIPKRNIQTPKLATPMEAADMLYWFCGEADKKGDKRANSIRGSIVNLVLILFCGIRREEACKVTWDDIDLNGEKIKVLIENAKKKKRRVNKATANVWNWFRYLKNKGADLDGFEKLASGKVSDPLRRLTYRQRQYRESFEKSGKPVPQIVGTMKYQNVNGETETKAANQNIMRHSFISYHMKLFHNAGLTARIAGNSEKQVENTYLEMVEDERDAMLWFAIDPPEIIKRESEHLTPEWDLEKAFEIHLKIKHLAANTGKSKEIAEAQEELVWELARWENQRDNETGELNMHKLAKKVSWWDDPKVKWMDGLPTVKKEQL
jgi:site-specific recombinase XerD